MSVTLTRRTFLAASAAATAATTAGVATAAAPTAAAVIDPVVEADELRRAIFRQYNDMDERAVEIRRGLPDWVLTKEVTIIPESGPARPVVATCRGDIECWKEKALGEVWNNRRRFADIAARYDAMLSYWDEMEARKVAICRDAGLDDLERQMEENIQQEQAAEKVMAETVATTLEGLQRQADLLADLCDGASDYDFVLPLAQRVAEGVRNLGAGINRVGFTGFIDA